MPFDRISVVNAAHVFFRVVVHVLMLIFAAKITIGIVTIGADNRSRLHILANDRLNRELGFVGYGARDNAAIALHYAQHGRSGESAMLSFAVMANFATYQRFVYLDVFIGATDFATAIICGGHELPQFMAH